MPFFPPRFIIPTSAAMFRKHDPEVGEESASSVFCLLPHVLYTQQNPTVKMVTPFAGPHRKICSRAPLPGPPHERPQCFSHPWLRTSSHKWSIGLQRTGTISHPSWDAIADKVFFSSLQSGRRPDFSNLVGLSEKKEGGPNQGS